MAYAAVTSLKNTIQYLLNSSRISIGCPDREILELAQEGVKSLQKALERFDQRRNNSERIQVLEGEMRETSCNLEDKLESHVSDLNEKHIEIKRNLSLDLPELRQDIDCFTEAAKKMEEEYIKELDNSLSEEEEDEEEDDGGGGNTPEMVGLSDHYHYIRDVLMNWSCRRDVSIFGMTGIGKTLLAKNFFEDPLTVKKFEHRAFVRVGQKYKLKRMLQAILAQVNPDCDKSMLVEGTEKLYEYLEKILYDKKYLIVLDDVWDTNFWHDLRGRLPGKLHGGLFLVTTRLQHVATFISEYTSYKMRFMNKEESWDLLRRKVFAEEVCPPQLEKAGKKIAENCEGLPLLIVKVANLLCKAKKTPEYWNEVAENKESSIFMDAYDQILKVLYRSYNYLPQYLKACFLYMGAFPPNYDVCRSKLINLWNAEGFVESNPSHSLQQYFEDLLSCNVVVVSQMTHPFYKVKAYGLHSVYRHLCKKEVGEKKFLRILNSYAGGNLAEGVKSQRRLCIYNNILCAIKDMYNSMASISTLRSLLCTGPYHQYQVPICVCSRLIRVLDAVTIRLYEFPMEVLKLVQLKYLALTYNGNLPPSISKLWNLQYFIFYRHPRIKSAIAQSYLPIEIWDLQELRYLEIMGRNLPDPRGAVLPNLLTLLDVGVESCTEGVLQGIPNLNKLRVQIELAPGSIVPSNCFRQIACLNELKSLKFVIVNPNIAYESIASFSSFLPFTISRLEKLTLSGFGYRWKDMSKIGALPFLKVLKLQCRAFKGKKWEVEERGFLKLRYLLIEDADLVQWKVGGNTFPWLRYLTIKNCYKLQEIPILPSLLHILLIDCSPLAFSCAKKMEANFVEVYGYFSWDDRASSHDRQLGSKTTIMRKGQIREASEAKWFE